MSTSSESNSSSPPEKTASPAPLWIDDLFNSIDAKDAQGFVEFLTDDATFYFGNAPGVHGSAGIADAVAGFFATIKALNHTLTLTIAKNDVVVCCGDVAYTRHDGSNVTLPFADTFLLHNDKVSEYRIYMDVTPLYAG